MNTKIVKLFLAALLSFHVMQSPIQTKALNNNASLSNAIPPTALVAVCIYVGYNYLIREDFLVENKFPHVQTWYNAMKKKYPAAHFDTKMLVQTPKLSLVPDTLAAWAKKCCWFTSFDNIYFKENDLKEISYIYKKVIDGYPLDNFEQLALARHEFILLHEAGHIEHNDSTEVLISIIGLLALTQGIDIVYTTVIDPGSAYKKTPKDKSYLFGQFEVPGVLFTLKGATFMAGLLAILRQQETHADEFARKLADNQTLKDALSLFEDEEVDPLFELETRTMKSYIKTKSTVGSTIQTVANPIEFSALLLIQQILLVVKSIPPARWLYDFKKDMTHEGPSIRAQKIKDELTRRNN